jgi:hypothetical protein
MDNATSNPLSPPPPAPRSHSPFGVASIVFFLISIIIILSIIAAFFLRKGFDPTPTLNLSFKVVVCGIGPISLIGIGLGAFSLSRPYKNKLLGILGIVFNTLIMVVFCLLMAFLALFAFGVMS